MEQRLPQIQYLTVLHSAERTGPPLFALRFLRWMSEHHRNWQPIILFLDDGGPLVGDFEELGTVVRREPPRRRADGTFDTVSRDREARRRLAELGPFDVAHLHCAGSFRAAALFDDVPVLAHIHELAVGLEYHLDPVARNHVPGADRYVTVSDAVRDALLARFLIDPRRVERQWGFVPEGELDVPPDRRRLLSDLDEDHGNTIAVVSSGVRHWRKAPELFLRVAHHCISRHPDIAWRFVWIGGEPDPRIDSLIASSGLADSVRFMDHVEDPLPLIAAADVFLLPAREDAFPLVCVEAAALGRPIVTFDNGGTTEIIEAGGCGRIVPFPRTGEVADVLAELARHPQERESMGAEGRAFARRELMLHSAGPRLMETLERTRTSR